MEPTYIASGTLSSGRNFIANSGLNIAILPATETAEGFTIDFNKSGAEVSSPSDSQVYLMAIGKWNPWTAKPSHAET